MSAPHYIHKYILTNIYIYIFGRLKSNYWAWMSLAFPTCPNTEPPPHQGFVPRSVMASSELVDLDELQILSVGSSSAAHWKTDNKCDSENLLWEEKKKRRLSKDVRRNHPIQIGQKLMNNYIIYFLLQNQKLNTGEACMLCSIFEILSTTADTKGSRTHRMLTLPESILEM